MAKATRRRRNGKVIKVRKVDTPVLSGEAIKKIMSGDANELYDSYGKVKSKYIKIVKR